MKADPIRSQRIERATGAHGRVQRPWVPSFLLCGFPLRNDLPARGRGFSEGATSRAPPTHGR